MISFHKAEAADRAWAHEILKRCAYPGAEYAFSCMYLWSDYFGELGRVGDHLTQHASWRGREVYLYPAGAGDIKGAIEAIRADAAERGGPLRLRSLTKDKKEELEALYPGKFEFTACRNSYDYIYTVEELSELHGKKLQSKRNHCNRFEDEFPDWFTAPITDENLPQCHEMLRIWYETHEPAVNAQELDQHLGAVHAVDAARIDQLRNEGREPERDVETPALELLDGRDTLRRRSCPLVSTGEGVVRGRHRDLDMGQSTVHYVNIAFPGHHGRFRYDQITDAAFVQHAYRFVCEPVDCLGGLETVRHAAHAYNRAGSKAGDGSGELCQVGHGRTARVSQAPELQQRTCVTVGAVVHAAAAVRVEPRRIAALAALVPRHGLEEGFELFRFRLMSFHIPFPFS